MTEDERLKQLSSTSVPHIGLRASVPWSVLSCCHSCGSTLVAITVIFDLRIPPMRDILIEGTQPDIDTH